MIRQHEASARHKTLTHNAPTKNDDRIRHGRGSRLSAVLQIVQGVQMQKHSEALQKLAALVYASHVPP